MTYFISYQRIYKIIDCVHKKIDFSNLVQTTPFWNNLNQVCSKAKQFKVLRAIEAKGINKISKTGCGHLCLKEENVSFICC